MLLSCLNLPDSKSPSMFHVVSFHDLVMIVVLFILSTVSYILLSNISVGSVSRSLKSSEKLESIWTLLPCFVLCALAAPSLATLYLCDEVIHPMLTVKVIGHQWYWSYECKDLPSNSESAYMVPSMDLSKGDLRLLETDAKVFIPLGVETRLIITSDDVIHSWSVPSLGVKMDGVPGRLNQIMIFPSVPGKVYGQCSEICGTLHSFMPICLEILPLSEMVKHKDF